MTLEQIHRRACAESRRELADLAADALGIARPDQTIPGRHERHGAAHAAVTAAVYLGWLDKDPK